MHKYRCVYLYIHIYIYIYLMHAYAYAYTHAYIHAYAYVYANKRICICIFIFIHLSIHVMFWLQLFVFIYLLFGVTRWYELLIWWFIYVVYTHIYMYVLHDCLLAWLRYNVVKTASLEHIHCVFYGCGCVQLFFFLTRLLSVRASCGAAVAPAVPGCRRSAPKPWSSFPQATWANLNSTIIYMIPTSDPKQ